MRYARVRDATDPVQVKEAIARLPDQSAEVVDASVARAGITAPLMVMRGDGGLMAVRYLP